MNPLNSPRLYSVAQFCTVAGAVVAISTMWISEDLALIGISLLVLAVLLQPRQFWHDMLREPMFWLLMAVVAFMTIHAWILIPLKPDTADAQWGKYRDWLRLWGFLPIAWLLRPHLRYVPVILLCLVLGFVLGRLLYLPELLDAGLFSGQRFHFGMPANMTGQFAAAIFVGLVLVSARFRIAARSKRQSLPRYLLWLALLSIALQCMFSTQSRGAFLALLIVLPLAYLILRQRRPKPPTGCRDPVYRLGSAFAAILMIVIAGLNYGNFGTRMQVQATSYEDFMSSTHTITNTGSVAARVHLAKYGLQRWWEKPVFGWGPESGKYLLQDYNYLQRFPHLHNSYVELLVQFGLTGMFILFAVAALMLRSNAKKTEDLAIDLRLVLASAIAFMALGGLYDVFVRYSEWREFWIFVAGLYYAQRVMRSADIKSIQGSV